jgi:hypothetical protein
MPGSYKLGKHPPAVDKRTLRFASYVTAGLPSPPASVDYGAKVSTWPMYANDQYGDCTCAAAGHMIQNWTANANGEATPATSAVVRFYEHFVGNPPPPDAGCNMLQVLNYWRKAGLARHKVDAYAALKLTDQTEAMRALYLFGSVYIGVALPDFAVQGDMLAVPWVVPPGGPVGNAAPNPSNGHCIPAVAYDADNLTVITWGAAKTMSWKFYNAYADEAFAVLSQDFIQKSGRDLNGFDLAALEADLKGL